MSQEGMKQFCWLILGGVKVGMEAGTPRKLNYFQSLLKLFPRQENTSRMCCQFLTTK